MKIKPIALALALTFGSAVHAQTVSSGELKLSTHLNQTQTPAGWKYATGQGVRVAVVDSGVTATNPDLRGAITVAPNTNFISGANNDVKDLNGHGTHVAGIIAARANGVGVVGAALDATLVPIRVASANGRVSLGALGQGIRRAAELAPIANVSIGGPACCAADVRAAVDQGLLIVAAAGNDGQSAPVWPARYARESWANGRIIAVGAVDQRNQITSWSNRAGDTQNFFLVAPGQWIISTKDNGVAYMTGTSMAAPQVAGAAALLKSRWTFLQAEQIADILFKSATDLGAPGTDPIYGRGLLNVERAMQPLGATYLINSKGQAVSVASIVVTPAPAYAAALKNATVKSVQFDQTGRDFELDLSTKIRSATDQSLSKNLSQPLDAVVEHTDKAAHESTVQLSDKNKMSIGALGTGLKFMNLAAGTKAGQQAASLLSNPALSVVAEHSHIGYAARFGAGLTVKTAALTTQTTDQFNLREPSKTQTRAVVAAAEYQFGSASLGISVTDLKENNAFLGGQGRGLDLQGAPNLKFVTISTLIELDENTAGFAQITRARSGDAATTTNGFAPTIQSADAFKFGLTQRTVWNKNDQLTLTVEQPLRVRTGHLTAVLPAGIDDQGRAVMSTQNIDLAAAGREVQLRADYVMQINKNKHVRTFAQVNNSPEHNSSNQTQSIFGFQLFLSF